MRDRRLRFVLALLTVLVAARSATACLICNKTSPGCGKYSVTVCNHGGGGIEVCITTSLGQVCNNFSPSSTDCLSYSTGSCSITVCPQGNWGQVLQSGAGCGSITFTAT
ncbi:hypothetical protein RAS1_29440 [Phycisphaerae bacterium RAS1]|nr:hypothetical protein RAS1_29440 [Phycisphaerae bacterium RAS1]